MSTRRAARVADIAQVAGVGTATVDRVLHARGGVSPATIQRVREAELAVSSGASSPKGSKADQQLFFHAILPADAGRATEVLGRLLTQMCGNRVANMEVSFVEKMNPAALAARLDAATTNGASGIAFQALDHPLVHSAVERVAAAGIPMTALLSNLMDSTLPYVGVDNRAAGRTAGFLMGRLVQNRSRVAVVWSGDLYRSHEEREFGFRSILRSDHPHLEVVDLVGGADDSERNYHQLRDALDMHPDLRGIYSVGGGNGGLVRALNEANRSADITVIPHNLTVETQRWLLDGTIDALVSQDLELAARRAIEALLAQCHGEPTELRLLPIEVVTRENARGHVID